MDPWGMAIPYPLLILSVDRGEKFTSSGDPQKDTGPYSPPSRGRWATAEATALAKGYPGHVRDDRGDPDRKPAIGSEASWNRDQAQRDATPFSRFSADRT